MTTPARRITSSYAACRTVVAVDDADYERSLRVLAESHRASSSLPRLVLLPNHAHLLVTSQLGNLSRDALVRNLHAQAFNRGTSARATSTRVASARASSRTTRYFLELVRYFALNPVRAGMCDRRAIGRGRATRPRPAWPAPWFLDSATFSGSSTDEYVAGSRGLGRECARRRQRQSHRRSMPALDGVARWRTRVCTSRWRTAPRIHAQARSREHARRAVLADLCRCSAPVFGFRSASYGGQVARTMAGVRPLGDGL